MGTAGYSSQELAGYQISILVTILVAPLRPPTGKERSIARKYRSATRLPPSRSRNGVRHSRMRSEFEVEISRLTPLGPGLRSQGEETGAGLIQQRGRLGRVSHAAVLAKFWAQWTAIRAIPRVERERCRALFVWRAYKACAPVRISSTTFALFTDGQRCAVRRMSRYRLSVAARLIPTKVSGA